MNTDLPTGAILGAILAVLASLWPDAQAMAQAASHPQPVSATYATPTDRYPHDIMGGLMAHTDLVVGFERCAGCAPETLAIRLSDDLVFEDFAPRLVDLDGDGVMEIVVVESHQTQGARLAVWDLVSDQGRARLSRGATTPYIGTRFRWLAPIGAADFDGDGAVEFAYVEKPHLDKILRIVRRDGPKLSQVASISGVTNHAIGQEQVHSRIEDCRGGPAIIALNADGTRIVSVRMGGNGLVWREIAEAEQRHHLNAGTGCEG